MQRSISSTKSVYRNLLQSHKLPNTAIVTRHQPPCDVFINHRGIDTKKNVAGLLYDHLMRLRLRPFLDSKNMKPGDKLFDKIDNAIKECKVGVAVFSPRYCQSPFCLHELARIMEAKKKVIPVFCDVKPSELIIKNQRGTPKHDLERFQLALEEAKYTVGLTFNSSNGDWPGFLMSATEAIIENMIEVEEEEEYQLQESLKLNNQPN
ncbi:probable 2' cyclic ADP-D-ribose synthase BdTIR [Rutidosis leptorrhynchoides]|uniref:probable 2' cyclic ADP-D-ribose synthase BdTIR n=1 Tax=Rutidosis leptorrhynchoides TaxID=125765 RepID=UPI003A9A2F68